MKLRDYQERTIDQLYKWWDTNKGNPCIVLPTGAGKSIIIAAFCQKALHDFPGTRILMCTHQKELIEQDYGKLLELWPEADAGIYSAGIGLKQLNNAITFASIQSIYRHAEEVGHVDLILIDEAHLINHEGTGMYRQFIDELKKTNPALKCIGLTATPYRLGHGMITDKPALFDKPLIEPVTITELQDLGHLCRLTSKATGEKLDVNGVKVVGGDYSKKELLEAVDVPGKNEAVVEEVIRRGSDRKAWLFFCSGVSHAEHIRDLLEEHGISAACVTGNTSKEDRERILQEFKDGKIRAVTNANVLTTGFDHPGIDLICMMRPTLSPGLYVQMAGRGLRPSSSKENCLVLDFAGNVETHGPITEVTPPSRARRGGKGPAPTKICPVCQEIIAMQYKACPVCMYEFPKTEETERQFLLSKLDINGGSKHFEMPIRTWVWKKSQSRAGNEMVTVRYYPQDLTQQPINEFLLLWHENMFIRERAIKRLRYLAEHAGIELWSSFASTDDLCKELTGMGKAPSHLIYHNENKYPKVDMCFWNKEEKVNAV